MMSVAFLWWATEELHSRPLMILLTLKRTVAGEYSPHESILC